MPEAARPRSSARRCRRSPPAHAWTSPARRSDARSPSARGARSRRPERDVGHVRLAGWRSRSAQHGTASQHQNRGRREPNCDPKSRSPIVQPFNTTALPADRVEQCSSSVRACSSEAPSRIGDGLHRGSQRGGRRARSQRCPELGAVNAGSKPRPRPTIVWRLAIDSHGPPPEPRSPPNRASEPLAGPTTACRRGSMLLKPGPDHSGPSRSKKPADTPAGMRPARRSDRAIGRPLPSMRSSSRRVRGSERTRTDPAIRVAKSVVPAAAEDAHQAIGIRKGADEAGSRGNVNTHSLPSRPGSRCEQSRRQPGPRASCDALGGSTMRRR